MEGCRFIGKVESTDPNSYKLVLIVKLSTLSIKHPPLDFCDLVDLSPFVSLVGDFDLDFEGEPLF